MSYLSKEYRLNNSRDFNQLYKNGKRWHTHSFVVFFSTNDDFKLAFVASKKVGNAVKRAEAKRKLRSLCLTYENKIQTGKYIFVAKEKVLNSSFDELKRDFKYAMKKLQILSK